MSEPEPRKCWHRAKDVIWIAEYQETAPSPLNPFITVERTVRRLLCLGCGREFEIEKRWTDDEC